MTTNVLTKEEFMKRYLAEKKEKEMLKQKKLDNYFYDSISRCKKRGKRK